MNDTFVTLHGWVGSEVTFRDPQGVSVANLRVATTPRLKRDGRWVDGETTWYSVTAWRQLADKRTTARFLAFGVNGLSVTLMIVVFAHTAGVTGAEAGIAGGSAVLGQKLLEAVFGDQAVRRLAARAREDLNSRVEALLDGERARFLAVLDDLGVEEGAADHLRNAARAVDDLRFAEADAAAGGDRS